jgi:hypothetical protein
MFEYEGELYNANFRETDLRGADFHFMSYANRYGANLKTASFYRADLRDATFIQADLGGANFCEANLCNANLSSAHLVYAEFRNADLTNVDFEESDLTKADLRGANVSGARFKKAILSEAKLDNIRTCGKSLALAGWILFQAAEYDFEKRSFAAGIILSPHMDWVTFKYIAHPARAWAIETLAKIDGFDNSLRKYGLLV